MTVRRLHMDGSSDRAKQRGKVEWELVPPRELNKIKSVRVVMSCEGDPTEHLVCQFRCRCGVNEDFVRGLRMIC